MGDAFECDGCGKLFRGYPTVTAVFGDSAEFETAGYDAGMEIDLCQRCVDRAIAPLFRESIDPSAATLEQDESLNGDREWKVDATQCPNCGKRYPADYSRCDQCGTPNQEV